MTPTLSHHARCVVHPYSLLTSEGACPRCDYAPVEQKPDTKHIPRQPTQQQRRAQDIHAKISRGKPGRRPA